MKKLLYSLINMIQVTFEIILISPKLKLSQADKTEVRQFNNNNIMIKNSGDGQNEEFNY